jgi:predicted transcriptional regulator
MDNDKTTSWIFMATAIASRTGGANVIKIAEIADGINHSVPTDQEIHSSLDRLLKLGLIIKNGENYELTSKGRQQYESSEKNSGSLFAIWEKLEKQIVKFA